MTIFFPFFLVYWEVRVPVSFIYLKRGFFFLLVCILFVRLGVNG